MQERAYPVNLQYLSQGLHLSISSKLDTGPEKQIDGSSCLNSSISV